MDPLTKWGWNILRGLLGLLAVLYGILWASGRGGRAVLAAAVLCGVAAGGLVIWARLNPEE